MNRTEKALAAVDCLLASNLDLDNLLLDLRLNLMRQEEPGLCVAAYFQLRRRLSAWYSKELEDLRGGLEQGIALEIIAADERRRRCLGLADESDLEDYCHAAMKWSALEFKDVETIHLSFCWS